LTTSGGDEGLSTFVAEAHAHSVKALVSIGGWTGSTHWSSNVATPEARSHFVGVILDLVQHHDLDGVDFE
jgi:chitinase